MASGVAIHDEVIEFYNLIKVRRQGEEEKERYKLVVMRLSEDLKNIVVDHSNCLKVKDVANTGDVFKTVISKLPSKECRYAMYDCTYETKESVKEDLVFIISAPDDAPMRSKMVYASSKIDLKKKLTGVKFEWQINDHTDKDVLNLVEKLGGKGAVKSLEGKSV
ncbi:non-muscle cofilin 1-like [Chanodichthys erythropterus]|uniref:non-muscle cofilin 1-like n=1 Tax=Chanodichthys erythropterus TaxID=933992 RepID=UPI00351E0272